MVDTLEGLANLKSLKKMGWNWRSLSSFTGTFTYSRGYKRYNYHSQPLTHFLFHHPIMLYRYLVLHLLSLQINASYVPWTRAAVRKPKTNRHQKHANLKTARILYMRYITTDVSAQTTQYELYHGGYFWDYNRTSVTIASTITVCLIRTTRPYELQIQIGRAHV